jgi:ribosomal protein S16
MTDTLTTLSPVGATLAILRRVGNEENRKSTVTFVDVDTRRDGKTIEVSGGISSAVSADGKRPRAG